MVHAKLNLLVYCMQIQLFHFMEQLIPEVDLSPMQVSTQAIEEEFKSRVDL